MSKLDEALLFSQVSNRDIPDESKALILGLSGVKEAKKQIKDLMLELIGEMEHRETDDMSLKSWSTDDYKAFGRNELKIELRQKVEAL